MRKYPSTNIKYILWVLSFGTSMWSTSRINSITFGTTYAYLNLAYDSVFFCCCCCPFVHKMRSQTHAHTPKKNRQETKKKHHHRSIEMNICDPFRQRNKNEEGKKLKAWLMKLAINGILMSPWDSFISFIFLLRLLQLQVGLPSSSPPTAARYEFYSSNFAKLYFFFAGVRLSILFERKLEL